MLSNKELNHLYQMFSILHQYASAGVNPVDGISFYSKSVENEKIGKALKGVLRDVGRGESLPEAMENHSDIFPTYIVELMKVNDATGQASEVYENIEDTLEQEIDLRRNMSSEVIPIVFLLIALVAAYVAAIFFVLPMMGGMMKDLGVHLPLISRFFLASSEFLKEYWYLCAAAAGAGIGGLFYMKKYKPRTFAKMLLNLPFYKSILYYRLQYQFAKIFGICIEAGIETSRALQFVAMASDNILMKDTLNRARASINRTGADLVMAIKQNNKDNVIDPSFYVMLEAGKQGNMEEVMKNRANYFKKQLLAASKSFSMKVSSTIITPSFGIMIAIFLSVYLPIFNMMGGITSGMGGLK